MGSQGMQFEERDGQSTVFDTSFKSWIAEQPAAIVPQLLPGAVYEETLTIEVIRPTLRTDKVFRVHYKGVKTIMHLEFESGNDKDLPARLMVYNSILYKDYRLPVISIVLYPFRVKLPQPSLYVKCRGRVLHFFRFDVLPLFLQEAERYVRHHVTCMYPLLPTMKGVNAALLKQAMDELATLYREDEVTLSQQFVWLELLLERATMVPPQEKVQIQERLRMYDMLWEEHPKVKQIRAESQEEGVAKGIAKGITQGIAQGIAQGKQEGIVEGELRAMKQMLVNIVSARFPALAELAQQRAQQVDTPAVLDLLIQQLATAPDEHIARWLLTPPAGAQ